MSTQVRTGSPRGLLGGILALTLLVIGLGGAVIAIKLRPEPIPTDSVHREIALWQDAVAANQDSAQAHTGLGMAFLGAGQDDDAQTEFERAIALDPKSWMASFQLGLLMKAADPQRAIKLLSTAARTAPEMDKVAPLIALGDFMLGRHRATEAAAAYRRAIVYYPFTFDGHFGLAQALEAQGERKAALKEYEEAKRFDPNNPDVAKAIARVSG